MSISVDWPNRLVISTGSIDDIVLYHDALRALEESDAGMLNPPIISYKVLDLGGGAFFYGLDHINGYQLKFPNPGNYTVIGNIGTPIVPVAGVFVDRTKAAAFATVSGTAGSSGPTAAQIAAEVLAVLQATAIPVDVKKVNSTPLAGSGIVGDEWGPA